MITPVVRCSTLTLVLALAAVGPVSVADCPLGADDGPRTLVLALDGVPLRVVEEARERGAFAGWPATSTLVSTFPSMTNVSFSAMFQPFGVEPARGYEVQFYDPEVDRVVGGRPWGYSKRLFAWRDTFDLTGTTVGGKLAIYAAPRKRAMKEFDSAERLVLETRQALVLAHVGSTDAMIHLRGDEKAIELLIEFSKRIDALKRRHLEQTGRTLQIVLLSDHGNTHEKIRSARDLRKPLKKAGLRPWNRLARPNDVIAATFGVVNYGALITAPSNAETAARAIAKHRHVQLATWVSRKGEISVVAKRGLARIRWRDDPDGRNYAYVANDGDPLELSAVVEAMRHDGALDAAGFASEAEWLERTVGSTYPDAPARLVDGLTGAFVENRGTVLFSLDAGRAWGWKSAHASAWVWGGRLEGTHGGLERGSSLGFYLADAPNGSAGNVLSARTVLERFADLETCRRDDATRFAGSGQAAETAARRTRSTPNSP